MKTLTHTQSIGRHALSLRVLLLGAALLLLAGCSGPGRYLAVSAGMGLAAFGIVSEVEIQPVEIFEEEVAVTDAVTDAESGMAMPKPTPAPSEEEMTGQSAADEAMAQTMDRLSEVKWVLVEEGEIAAATALNEISFSLVDGRISGSAGCNRFNAGYRLDNGQIQIAGIASTRMACEPDVMARENAFLTSLSNVTAIQMDGEDLLLTTPDGALRFEARSAE